ncbi:YitT family protein [Mesobacillus maritimus]|uniref:YczE/YyaS/YitT family protein n=1 Tax=Mesobacillus maritimus TaxID=1643336 RepID=UPI00203A9CBA|nr:YitT family protein [Mesobacillus maritimus]MCM3587712.1 YitT family protein [Mesobacillus maritimus]MCM3669957.1 YitT family protein [Mesobacillus maritimus]
MLKKKGQVFPRILVYLVGLLVMALGIVLLLKSDLGVAPWDVLHVGLYYQFGLTIGTWSVLAGFFILTLSALIAKEFPQIGAFVNMLLVGTFIDLYLLLPFLVTPESLIGRAILFSVGILLLSYGMGIYISAQFGAGPRDSLMIALAERTGWKIRTVRSIIEIVALFIGWRLGGPVFWGTIVYSITIGQISGFALPQCQRVTDFYLAKLEQKQKSKHIGDKTNRSAVL